ncbi:MAG: aminodeoxychorismate/anthranilate synthase component II [SAR324 cluster bacterium]|nr:aminodeoxychorismate/anthranilate synthase component II [SAR324 cluster bacterium]
MIQADCANTRNINRVVVVDNYDSFTYNLVQAFGILRAEVRVVLNDKTSLSELEAMEPTHVCISPGPGTPAQSGISKAVIEHFKDKIPVLGVCLGHQCIIELFGGKVISAPKIMHGKASPVFHQGTLLFENLPNPMMAMRYHSLIGCYSSLPACLIPEAWTAEQELMAVRHREFQVFGIQFHPESILTPEGPQILERFLSIHPPETGVFHDRPRF